jgi:translocon-associated protein subunit beta
LVYFFLQTSHIVCSGGILSHTFELEAKSKGVFSGEPAVIKFRVPTNAALQV